MNRIEQTIVKALDNIGGDRYKLSLMVAARVEQLSSGSKVLVDGVDVRKMKFSDIALLEIASGKITVDGIVKTDK